MIPLEVIDNNTIEFDGEKYFGFDLKLLPIFVFTNGREFPALVLRDKVSRFRSTKHQRDPKYTQEPWGYWNYNNEENNIQLVVITTVIPGIMNVSSNLFFVKPVIDTCELLRMKVIEATKLGIRFSINDISLIPNWVKYINNSEKKYKIGSPLPHALLTVSWVNGGGHDIVFLDKKAAERFKKEMDL